MMLWAVCVSGGVCVCVCGWGGILCDWFLSIYGLTAEVCNDVAPPPPTHLLTCVQNSKFLYIISGKKRKAIRFSAIFINKN